MEAELHLEESDGGTRLIEVWLRWKIGSWEEVRIWKDKWIPGLDNFQVYSYSPFMEWDAKDSSLIDQESRTWRKDLLEIIFTHEKQQAILAIPLSSRIEKDVLCWSGDESGKYSVKSGYLVESKRVRGGDGRDTRSNEESDFAWKKLWKLNLPGKLKTFIWKAANNILPVGVRVSKKVRYAGDECPNCGAEGNFETLFG
ncbi:unnamed protein product [Linum trigynum]|uniref:Reverse transcriptase zinc-binding domain-containing protein n=1 Tax=Linum trigynum TaxID=586398 RepID=A0AAV2G581_9ROSI